jgi:hypothetical protein
MSLAALATLADIDPHPNNPGRHAAAFGSLTPKTVPWWIKGRS